MEGAATLAKFYRRLSCWVGNMLHRHQSPPPTERYDDGGCGESSTVTPSPVVAIAVECYACTQPGIPAFHSTTCCDRSHSPEWRASAGSSLAPPSHGAAAAAAGRRRTGTARVLGPVLDPRSKAVQRWNRAFLLVRAVALAVDPLFFYSLSVGGGGAHPCIYMDGGLAAVVTALRTCADAAQVAHVWLQLRQAYVSRESLVVGCGKLVWDGRAIAEHYLCSLKGFWFDIFVILPIPQMVFWFVLPKLIRDEEIKLIMTILLLIFLFQFLPKVYHSVCMMRKMQQVTGYIFGTVWWGFGLNLVAFFIASHVAGGCWYVLAIQRVASCLRQQCKEKGVCDLVPLSCSKEVCFGLFRPPVMKELACDGGGGLATPSVIDNQDVPVCLRPDGPFPYGIYNPALPVVSSNSLAVKVLYPIFWGLMTISTFGNDLEPTSNWLEVIFSIVIVLSGLMLFTLLIGNIQVFLHAVMARKRKMQVRSRDVEWWMKRRQLPSPLRQRVRRYEHQRWVAMRGEDEMDVIGDLPEGLRRDIKRHLCLDLFERTPLFRHLDDLILDNICDRLKPMVFSRGEKVIREGDPVQRMVFVVRGRLVSSQKLSKGVVATSELGPGGFLGDELLPWCLRRPFVDRLPASSATFECVEPAEAFGLEATHLRYVTRHFRYKFASERLKRTARYHSSNWRTWGAINIQLAWRRHRGRARGCEFGVSGDEGGGDGSQRLRHYAAMFLSVRPHDHLE